MNKNILRPIFLVGTLIFLSGCASRTKPVENWKDVSWLENADYSNLVMPETITVPEATELYTFSNTAKTLLSASDADADTENEMKKIEDEYAKDACADIYKLFGYTDFDTDKITGLKLDYADNTYSFQFALTSEDEKRNVILNYPKEFSWIDDSLTGEKTYLSDLEYIHLDRGEKAEKVYSLSGEEYSVDDALDYVDGILDSLSEYHDGRETLRAREVMVTSVKGNTIYRMIYEKTIDGIPLSSGNNYKNCFTGFSKPTYWYFEMDAPDHISCWSTYYSNEYDDESFELYAENGEYISSKGAADILSEYLAPEKVYTVRNVSVEYVCITHVEEGTSTPVENVYKPMWTFVLDESSTSIPFANNTLQTCAYVDMLTGDVYVVDDVEDRTFFEM